MLTACLRQWLTTPVKAGDVRLRFWLGCSLVSAGLLSWLVLRQGFAAAYVVQDDARQHVFWMQRFIDPGLFPNDWIADYYQSVAPWGYANFYRIFAAIGIHPLLLNKVLGFPLGLITTAYGFGISLQLLPVPAAGFIATLLLNQNLWLEDDLASGTARAFLYPIFLGFLYYLGRRALLPCLGTILLEGLFYPQFVLVMAGVLLLRLCRWHRGLKLSQDPQDYRFCIVGLAVAFGVLLPYVLETSAFGPVITAAAAKTMPEFGPDGRNNFFVTGFWNYWLTARRSGALLWVMPLCILSPLLLWTIFRAPARFPLVRWVRLSLLLQVFLTALGLFFAAHALLFKLYLPSRYLHNALQILTPFAAGVAVIVILDGVFNWAEAHRPAPWRQLSAGCATLVLSLILLGSPELYLFPTRSFVIGQAPAVYEFFARQPRDILIASLAKEADTLPAFTQRSILAGREYAIAYHTGYYREIRQRAQDLIRAQYSPDLSTVQAVIQKYGIDYWLLDRAYLLTTQMSRPGYVRTDQWLRQFQPVLSQAQAQLDEGRTPALVNAIDRCAVLEAEPLIVLEATCLWAQP